jgi:serine/threonine protein phosphatase PrpC
MAMAQAFRIEAATGLSLGDREHQEDAVLCDMPQGDGAGIAVLADGLGGHVAGALASRLAVTTAMQKLAAHRDPGGGFDAPLPRLLRDTVQTANAALVERIACEPEVAGMGTTLVVVAIENGALYWASVGDSLLMLRRKSTLRQLNEVHSLAHHLDLLARAGEIAPEEAATHPGRSCLTSALGAESLDRIDCPDLPIPLMEGDTVLLASDGLLTLPEPRIAELLSDADAQSSADRATALLDAVAEVGAEAQDNTSVAVLQARPATPARHAQGAARGFGRPHAAVMQPFAALRARFAQGSSAQARSGSGG